MFSKKSSSTYLKPNRGTRIHKLMQLGKYDKALELLEAILSENPEENEHLTEIYMYYGECLIHSGRISEALEFLNRNSSDTCREVMEETAVPAMEKFIKQEASIKEAFSQVRALEKTCPSPVVKVAVQAFLQRAVEHFKQREFDKASSAYNMIFPLAEKHETLDFDHMIRAGDSNFRSGQINKAWKIYESAKGLSNTFNKRCRLHKKMADILVEKQQNWYAILHFLAALQAVPSDRGAKTKLKQTLKRIGQEHYYDRFLELNSENPEFEQLETSLLTLKKQLKAG